MPRITLSLLLIPGVLLTQFAAVPHAHGADHEPHPGHQHPHFHFHQFSPSGTHRGTNPACCCAAPGAPVQVLTAPDGDPPDHDADAVYVEAGTAVPERLDHGRTAAQPFAAPAPPQPLDFLGCVVTRPIPPPDRAAARCPLYVRHLTLTI